MINEPIKLLSDATAVGEGTKRKNFYPHLTFQAVGTTDSGDGGSATVNVEVSNDGENWIEKASLSLTLTAGQMATAGAALNEAWSYVRGNVTEISGTGSVVNLWMGYQP